MVKLFTNYDVIMCDSCKFIDYRTKFSIVVNIENVSSEGNNISKKIHLCGQCFRKYDNIII